MSSQRGDEERRLIPRWRSRRGALIAGELCQTPLVRAKLSAADEALIKAKSSAYNDVADDISAMELITAALLCDVPRAGRFAASELRRKSAVASASSVLADAIDWDEGPKGSLGLVDAVGASTTAQKAIGIARMLLRDYPRNAYLWAELSRAYATLGLPEKALFSMDVALKLAPYDRYVTRAAARFFVHIKRPDKAHTLLSRFAGIRRDPWILSAEISTSAILKKSSRLIKTARELSQDGNVSPLSLSELNGSLASIELEAGDFKTSKRLFKASLKQPTDNALAQAIWAESKMDFRFVEPKLLQAPKSFEANALSLQAASDWDRSLTCCSEWQLDEPFSSRPAITGSYLASVALGDFDRAAKFARDGLRANPRSGILHNNLAVSLLMLGKIEESFAAFKTAIEELGADIGRETSLATRGLLSFRYGDIEQGKVLYEEAIRLARGNGDRRTAALAACHLLQETINAKVDEEIDAAMAFAQKLTVQAKAPEITAMFNRVKDGHARE